jgi:hypothetical protein
MIRGGFLEHRNASTRGERLVSVTARTVVLGDLAAERTRATARMDAGCFGIDPVMTGATNTSPV